MPPTFLFLVEGLFGVGGAVETVFLRRVFLMTIGGENGGGGVVN